MNKKTIRITSIAVAAATFVAGIATMSIAATQTNGSFGPLHIFGTISETLIAPATQMTWTADIVASSSDSSIDGAFACPATSDGYKVFVSTRGQETTQSNYKGYRDGSLPGTKNVSFVQMRPSQLSGLTYITDVKTAGGAFSLGIACTSNNGNTVDRAYYRYIDVEAGSGSFTAVATADDEPESTPTPTPTADPTLTGSIAMSATTIAAVNGALSLSVPASAAATFDSPRLENNKSTTDGTLPNVTVTDGRVVTRQGWTLSANVADFVNGSVTIGKANLGIAPSVVAGSTTASGVTAGTATVAGSATYPFTFAEAAASQTVGNSVLGGNLTFVAPQDKAAGTYTSTLTLTLASK
jgi:hypothetical protein